MSIPIVEEPEDFGPPYERCYFCDEPTNTWYELVDIPVCNKCSELHDVSEVSLKSEWIDRE